jgi:hypothetical protein
MAKIPTQGLPPPVRDAFNRINDQEGRWSFSTPHLQRNTVADLPQANLHDGRAFIVLDDGGSPALAVSIGGVWRTVALT